MKDRIEALEAIKGGSTFFANKEGVRLYDTLLQIDREQKGLIEFVYGNDLLDVMDVEHVDSLLGNIMLAGAIITKEGNKYLNQLRKEVKDENI